MLLRHNCPSAMSGKLLFVSISRDGTLLCEAWADEPELPQAQVVQAASKLQARRTTPGWDFVTFGSLKGTKISAILDSGSTTIAVVAIHDASLETQSAKDFVAQTVITFKPLLSDPSLELTAHLSAQSLFASILEQRLARVNSREKVAAVARRVDEVKEIMHENIETMLLQHEKVSLLEEKAQEMSAASKQFKKATTAAKRFHYWNQAKMGLAVGTAATVVTAAVVTPIIVALV